MAENGYFSFQTTTGHVALFNAVCVGSSHNKKLANKYIKNEKFSTRVGTIVDP